MIGGSSNKPGQKATQQQTVKQNLPAYPSVEIEQWHRKHKQRDRIVKQMLYIPVNERRKQDPPKSFHRPRIYAEIIKIVSKPDLKPEHQPDDQHKTNRISQHPRRKNEAFFLFQILLS